MDHPPDRPSAGRQYAHRDGSSSIDLTRVCASPPASTRPPRCGQSEVRVIRRPVLRTRAAYLACCLLWGSSWMMIKIGLRDLPPFLFAGSRMVLASAVLLPFAVRAGLRGYGRRSWGFLIGLGLLQIGIPYALLFSGQQWVPSALAAVLFAPLSLWVARPAGPLRSRRERRSRSRTWRCSEPSSRICCCSGCFLECRCPRSEPYPSSILRSPSRSE